MSIFQDYQQNLNILLKNIHSILNKSKKLTISQLFCLEIKINQRGIMEYIEDFLFISEDKCKKIQLELKDKVELENNFKLEDIKYVAGIDLAYWMENEKETAVCCITIIDIDTKEIVEEVNTKGGYNISIYSRISFIQGASLNIGNC